MYLLRCNDTATMTLAHKPSLTRRSFPGMGRPHNQSQSSENVGEDIRAKNRTYQRAFRQRQAAQVDSLTTKVKTLEDSLEVIGTALTALSDVLQRNNALQGESNIVQPLYTALKAAAQTPVTESTQNTQPLQQREKLGKESEETISQPQSSSAASRKSNGSSKVALSKMCIPTDVFSQDTTIFPLFAELSAPINYAHLEGSFARQLHRTCFYRTLRLIKPGNLPISPEAESTFKVALYFYSAETIRVAALRKLFGPPVALFDHMDSPYLNVGGSGTHYARLDVQGEPLLDAQAWVLRAIEYFPQPVQDNAFGQDLDSILAETGCEGEWLDTNDVEQYLRSFGFNLTGNPSTIRFFSNQKPYLLDLSQFTHHMSELGICLGRSPGFRKSDVMRAFVMSASNG